MSNSYRYPEQVSKDEEFTPELMVLWDDAMRELRAKRNKALLWQVPAFLLFLPVAVLLFNVWGLLIVIVTIIGFGLACTGMHLRYYYSCSDDRSSAKFQLKYEYEIKDILEFPSGIFSQAKEGVGGLYLAATGALFLPISWPVRSATYFPEFFNQVWWLKGWKNRTAELRGIAEGKAGRQHLKGTDVLPSMPLSGSSPLGEEPAAPEPLEVFGGRLILNPDGGLVIPGGPTFDGNSTFSSFAVNGMSLTRQSGELLSITAEDQESSFRYDGSSWSEV